MYVRKFEAETMEEALKSVKKELGPDAIILKTLTNKGLKGAFKKNRIEVTAAISEKNYTSKAKVDNVLTDDQKESFYNSPSSYISNMIDNQTEAKPAGGYSQMGLNRSVQSKATTNTPTAGESDLDSFLNAATKKISQAVPRKEVVSKQEVNFDDDSLTEAVATVATPKQQPQNSYVEQASFSREEYEKQQAKIDELEKKLFEVSKDLERVNHQEPIGIYELRTVLRSLQISEVYIQKVSKKAIFELSKEETMNPDTVFEFALREMFSEIKTELPLFSDLDGSEAPSITVLLSDSSSGQSSMALKLGALKGDPVVVKCHDERGFAEDFLNMTTVSANGIGEIITNTRKSLEAGKHVFIDFKNEKSEFNEVKKFIDGLKRSFGRVEVLVCLSAIHSELYNMQLTNRYGVLADGMIFTNLDLCLNFGSLFNIASEHQQLPLKFFGTGDVVPDDIEAASAERILSGMFNLK